MHRRFVALVILAVTGLAVAGMWVPVNVNLLSGLMSDPSRVEAYSRRAEQLGGDSADLIFLATDEGDRLFTRETLNAIRNAAAEIRELSEVREVTCLTDVPQWNPSGLTQDQRQLSRTVLRQLLQSGGTVGELQLPPYWPESDEGQRALDVSEFRRRVMSDDVLRGRLVSRDACGQAMLVWLTPLSGFHITEQSDLESKIRAIIRKHGLGTNGSYATGVAVVQSWMFREMERAVVVLLPAGLLIVSILVYLIFGRMSYVVLTIMISAISITWAVGATAWIFGKITLLVAAAPLLILVISTSDTIHLASAYATEIDGGVPPAEAARKVFRDVGGACLLTSLTTFVGFSSLTLIPAESVRHLALALAVGVASALLLAVTLVPIALSSGGIGRPTRRLEWTPISVISSACRRLSLHHPRLVIFTHVAAVVIAVVATSTLEFDPDFTRRFPTDHPLQRSAKYFEEQLGGTATIDVFLQADPQRLVSQETIGALREFESRVAEIPEFRHAESVTNWLSLLDRWLDNDADRSAFSKPDKAIRLLNSLAPGGIGRVISVEDGIARVTLSLTPTRLMQIVDLAEEVDTIASEVFPNDVTVESTGYHVMIGRAARVIISSQVRGSAVCFLCVMTVVALGVRSIRLTLFATLPNLLPIALLGGIIRVAGPVADSDLIGVAIVSFGLAVDDTIHFLHRFDLESTDGVNLERALRRTYDYTGRAIIRTTIILGCGLLPFAFSEYASIRMLGTYLVFVLVAAVLSDLLFLPALTFYFIRRGERKEQLAQELHRVDEGSGRRIEQECDQR